MRNVYVENNEKFYKNLYLYKSSFYKNANFISKSNDEDFNSIISALNIKSRIKRIKFIYDYCCRRIDTYNEGKNICGFNEAGQCYAQQYDGCTLKNGCCRLCALQNPNGCKTSNLTCKMFYCKYVTDKNKVLKYKDLKILKLFSLRQRLIIQDDFFSTRESVLFDLYCGSIIIYSIRLSIRIVLNFIKLKSNKFI